ncbi:MAG: hypothetical protein V4691_06710 [Pseudomonadota bacterium]
MAQKILMVCAECGSDDVLADAYAEWNVDAQKWELQNAFDKGAYCNSCEQETRLNERELPRKKASHQLAQGN